MTWDNIWKGMLLCFFVGMIVYLCILIKEELAFNKEEREHRAAQKIEDERWERWKVDHRDVLTPPHP